jgi:hypothetical protein
MQRTVKWLPKPEHHDYLAAEDYLCAQGLVRTVIGRGIFVTRLDERKPDRQREEGKDE